MGITLGVTSCVLSCTRRGSSKGKKGHRCSLLQRLDIDENAGKEKKKKKRLSFTMHLYVISAAAQQNYTQVGQRLERR